jgi:hypothetical protein
MPSSVLMCGHRNQRVGSFRDEKALTDSAAIDNDTQFTLQGGIGKRSV